MLISLLNSLVCRSVIRRVELRTLYMCDIYRRFCNIFASCFAKSYEINYMSNEYAGFMQFYCSVQFCYGCAVHVQFHVLCVYCVITLFQCLLYNVLVVLCWFVVNRCKLITLCKVISFVFQSPCVSITIPLSAFVTVSWLVLFWFSYFLLILLLLYYYYQFFINFHSSSFLWSYYLSG